MSTPPLVLFSPDLEVLLQKDLEIKLYHVGCLEPGWSHEKIRKSSKSEPS